MTLSHSAVGASHVACTAKSQYEHRRVQKGTCTYSDRGRSAGA